MVDDLFASWTADPRDDLLAAADNTYLAAREGQPRQSQQADALPAVTGFGFLPCSPPAVACLPPPPGPICFLESGIDLRFRLACLQF
jgi:hypothetical protein